MKKKGINDKEVNSLIEKKIKEGKSRSEILEELSEIYYDRKKLANLIALTPKPERRKKYKIYNDILLLLLILTIFSRLLIGVLVLADISIFATPFAFIYPLITLYFAIEVSKFRAYIYKILGLLALISVGDTIIKVEDFNFFFLLNLSIGIAVTFLTFYVGNKVFPNYGFGGPKEDEKGNILLE